MMAGNCAWQTHKHTYRQFDRPWSFALSSWFLPIPFLGAQSYMQLHEGGGTVESAVLIWRSVAMNAVCYVTCRYLHTCAVENILGPQKGKQRGQHRRTSHTCTALHRARENDVYTGGIRSHWPQQHGTSTAWHGKHAFREMAVVTNRHGQCPYHHHHRRRRTSRQDGLDKHVVHGTDFCSIYMNGVFVCLFVGCVCIPEQSPKAHQKFCPIQ